MIEAEPHGPGPGHLLDARRTNLHQALVVINPGNTVAPGLTPINADAYGDPFGPPVVQVETAQGATLRVAAHAQAIVTLTVRMTTTSVAASNVGATVPGTDPMLAPLVVMTPRSAWWTCTSERGGGLVAWLELLRTFSQTPPLRTVHFTANTGHELGHVGLDHYLGRHSDRVRDAHCWVHLGANFAAKDGRVLYQASDDHLVGLGTEHLAAADQPPDRIIAVGSRPLGEARNIFDGGGRYVSLLGSNPLFHHPDDRWPEAIDLDKTLRLTQAIIALTTTVANERERPGSD